MRRRLFVKTLLAFTGALAFDWKFEFISQFPFAHRRVTVPQVIATTTAVGPTTLTLSIPPAQKGDVLIAMVTAYNPDGKPVEWADVPAWTLHSSSESGECVQACWYQKLDSDPRQESATFPLVGERAAGQLHVIRGADVERT